MSKMFRNAFIALALLSTTAMAAPYEMGVVRIDIPTGFAGPVTQQPDLRSTVTYFVKHYPNDTRGTLLEITTLDSGGELKSMPESMRASTTDTYLKRMLDGVAKRRTAFKSSPLVHTRIGGVLASLGTWTGIAQGQTMSGAMYCAIFGGVVVLLHTQDFDDAPAGNHEQAVRAIETVTFKAGRYDRMQESN